MLRMSQAVAGSPGSQGEGVLARPDDATLVDTRQPPSWMRVRWLVRLISSLVVSRWAGFTPTLDPAPQELSDVEDRGASQ
jgi:hypothetical protein